MPHKVPAHSLLKVSANCNYSTRPVTDETISFNSIVKNDQSADKIGVRYTDIKIQFIPNR
jgi:hypothetical protein